MQALLQHLSCESQDSLFCAFMQPGTPLSSGGGGGPVSAEPESGAGFPLLLEEDVELVLPLAPLLELLLASLEPLVEPEDDEDAGRGVVPSDALPGPGSSRPAIDAHAPMMASAERQATVRTSHAMTTKGYLPALCCAPDTHARGADDIHGQGRTSEFAGFLGVFHAECAPRLLFVSCWAYEE